MRILIVSDVHANFAALETVLRDAERGAAVDGVWSLGDCVGYGPRPGECIARLRGVGAVMVAGNHERAATGAIGTEDFNPDAAAAAEWTKTRLSGDEKAFLDSLDEVIRVEVEGDGDDLPVQPEGDPRLAHTGAGGGFTLVHGTLRWPIWEYMTSPEVALGHLALQETPFGLVGHTHVPMVVVEDEAAPDGCEMYRLDDGDVVGLGSGRRIVLNPGSVGQPRDGDRRASYAVYDTEANAITLHRVEYEIAETQKLMAEEGLPLWLIQRLAVGR
jgi:predicted phosphodiesterase